MTNSEPDCKTRIYDASTIRDAKNTLYQVSQLHQNLVTITSSLNSIETLDKLAVLLQLNTQLRLVTINACIETQKSGEDGQRFKVIFEELGILAENSFQTAIDTQLALQHTSLLLAALKTEINTGSNLIQVIAAKIEEFLVESF